MSEKFEADLVFSCGEDNYLPAVDVWLVIDVLRATTVMTRWFELGGIELYPVKNPDEARNLVNELKTRGSSPLLMGEVNGLPPEGFDVGNSPLELNYEIIQSHYCGVMSTTNGTVALCQASSTGSPVIAVSFRNYSACLDYALTLGNKIGILCSGRKRRPSWEDTLCAGAVIEEFNKHGKIYMSDSAKIALNIWQNRDSNLVKSIMNSEHAVYLEQIGFANDIKFCAELNASTVVPMLSTEENKNILRSVSGSSKPYKINHEKLNPFEELLNYTKHNKKENQ